MTIYGDAPILSDTPIHNPRIDKRDWTAIAQQEGSLSLPDRIARWQAEGVAICGVIAAKVAEHRKALQELSEHEQDVRRALDAMPDSMREAMR